MNLNINFNNDAEKKKKSLSIELNDNDLLSVLAIKAKNKGIHHSDYLLSNKIKRKYNTIKKEENKKANQPSISKMFEKMQKKNN